MHNAVTKTILALIWLGQFYSVIGLVVWINKDISAPKLNLQKISAAIYVQKIIMTAISLFFAGDYLYNLLDGGRGAAATIGSYALSCAIFLFIPALFLLVLLKTKKRFSNHP